MEISPDLRVRPEMARWFWSQWLRKRLSQGAGSRVTHDLD